MGAAWPVASAHAASGVIELPEPSSLFLLVAGIEGVVAGRKLSNRPPDR